MPARCHSCGEELAVVLEVDLTPLNDLIRSLDRRLASIESKEHHIMATIDEVNAKLSELVKDVRRVLALVSAEPVSAATQQQVDDLAARLDGIDSEVEAVSPEPTDGSTPPADGTQPTADSSGDATPTA